ncbi:let-767 [Pristionchus pacificus]|uniref:Let-767 protein n=1 Tax=Pristionchus pacificus TaxID=54126 RepID=A0A2A6BPF0_PRIPA|nr:let-767 [Pristionchus pacificus]|eukprot:PDM67779.1 let-767 protein [Pristionchus pacificus]
MVCQCTLNFLGYSALALIAYRIFTAVYNVLFPYFIGAPLDLHKKAGAKWAVVTGATDGIGKAYATQLAKKKFNVYLISRTQSKLDETKKEIETAAPGVEVRTYAFDFGASTKAAYEPLIKELEKVEIGILVNNVGMSFEYPEVLHAQEGGLQRLADMTTINCLPPVLLSAVALKQMSERKAGIVINIASAAGYNEMSHWNVYSAGKRFVLHLSGILRAEYAGAGVTVQAIAPMLVATKMSKIKRASFFGPFADAFVAQALRTVGLVHETTGYFSHQIQAEIMNLLPQMVRDKIISNQTLAVRAAALRKKAKAQ